MEIKEVLLDGEREQVKAFLSSFGLGYREDTEYTAYIESGGEIKATVSYAKNIIMQLAISPEMQGENLAATLVSHVIARMREAKIYGYRVFTKPENINIFLGLGFRLLVQSDKFAALEGGESDISRAVSALKVKIDMELGGIEADTAAIVINGNPFTEGHLALCEYALARHKRLLLFVLEEDLSYFSYKERMSLAFLATRAFRDRVSVLPSTDYIVSRATFPDYFLHTANEATSAYAEYDALIFKKYFMSELGIKKRYFGSENTDYMKIYNEAMRNVLGEGAELVKRFEKDGKEISAKDVRRLVEEGRIKEAINLVPTSCRAVISFMINGKITNV